VAACGEAHEPDALGAFGPSPADLGPHGLQRHRVPHVERVTEHAGLDADLAEPGSHGLGFVRSVLGVPAAGQDDHVRAGHRGVQLRAICSTVSGVVPLELPRCAEPGALSVVLVVI